MAPEYWYYFENTKDLDMELAEKRTMNKFWTTYSERNHSSSKVGHLGRGWFMVYDHPLAERWFREHPDAIIHKMTDTSYLIVEFTDLQTAMMAKLKWC